MNRLDQRFQQLKARGEKGLLCLVAMGDPDLEATRQVARIYADCGVDVIELALPARHLRGDSGSLSAALQRAAAKYDNLDVCFETIKQIRTDLPTVPLEVAVTSETLEAYGVQTFVEKLVETDMDAVLVGDMHQRFPSLGQALDGLLSPHGVYRIRFMPHPFSESFIPDVKANGRGFAILQTIARPDGSRLDVASENGALIHKLRAAGVIVPIVLAYGIRTPTHIRKAVKLDADGVLIGTVLVEANLEGGMRAVESLLRKFRLASRVKR